MPVTLLDALSRIPLHARYSRPIVDRAAALAGAGAVSRPALTDRKAAAWVVDRRAGRVRVQLRLAGDGSITTACGCGKAASGCVHVAALSLLLGGGVEPQGGGSDVAESPEAAERRRRIERARSGLFRVTPDEPGQAFGGHQVRSPSGQCYGVILRSLDQRHNSCSCQDFLTNRLGTCKHIEAVMLHVAGRPRLRAMAARRVPRRSFLHVAHDAEPEVRLRRAGRSAAVDRLAARWFDRDGRLRAALAEAWPDLAAAAAQAGVEVPAEVEALGRRAMEQVTAVRRQAEIEAEVRRAGAVQPGFRGRLYPYQVDGVAFLASRGRALLADDMGLGKTAQAIAAMVRLFRKGDIARALVVCPASLKHQWAAEIERFVGLPGVRAMVIGGNREARSALYRSPAEIIITSYELVRADEREVAGLGADLLVLDEAQRIKNWRTRTADVVKRLPTRMVFALTGTPLENRLDDLYSLMQVVDPHVLGPLWRFNQDFATTDDVGRPAGYRNLGELRARIRPVFLRRRKDEVLDQLPDRIDTRIVLPLDAEQRELHDEAEGTVSRLLAILRRRPLSPIEEQRLMRGFQRMRMACDAASLCGGRGTGSPKLAELERLLTDLCIAGGHKVIVFSEWERMQELAAAIARRLRIGHVRLHGGVPSDKRGALIARFREDPSCSVFFSTDAGGVGLNLQAASHVINLDLPWNPAVLAQRIARVHRLGQRTAVNVVLMVAESSIESRMEGTLLAKRSLFEAAVGDSEADVIERGSLAKRLATVLGQSFAAGTGPAPADQAPDAAESVRRLLGSALVQALKLPDGRIVALVADGVIPPQAEIPDVVVLPAAAAEALQRLGGASPLAGAEILYSRAGVDAPDTARRDALVVAAERKLAVAESIATGTPVEALALVHAALALLIRAAGSRDPGDDPASLLAATYGELVPAGTITDADAHALSRSGELARAFALSPVGPAPALVTTALAEARDLLSRLRERAPVVAAPPVDPEVVSARAALN